MEMVLVNFPLKSAHLRHFLSPHCYLSPAVAAAHQVMQSEAKCTDPCHPLTVLPGYCTPDVLPHLSSACEPSPCLFRTPFIPVLNWTSPRRPPHPSPLGFRVSETKGRELSPAVLLKFTHWVCELIWEAPAHMGSVPRESILNLKYISCVRHIRKINDSVCRSLGISFMIFVYERQKSSRKQSW